MQKNPSQNGIAEISDIVHSVVIFLDNGIFSGFFVPPVQRKFTDCILAVFTEKNLVIIEQVHSGSYAVQNVISCLSYAEFSVFFYRRDETCGGWVNNHIFNVETVGEFFEC